MPGEGWVAVRADMLRVRGTSWLAATFVSPDHATRERLARGIGRSARPATPAMRAAGTGVASSFAAGRMSHAGTGNTEARGRGQARRQVASTQAGEFVREEIHHVREGKHGARSAKQAIAIGLSKARRAGVKLPAPPPAPRLQRSGSAGIRQPWCWAPQDAAVGSAIARRDSQKLKSEPRRAASHFALSRHATMTAKRRTRRERSAAAKKAARTRENSAAPADLLYDSASGPRSDRRLSQKNF